MAGGYAPVANNDADDHTSHIPNSPPPSFRSAGSSPRNSTSQTHQTQPDTSSSHGGSGSQAADPLADAFGDDDSEGDNDGDDRQRLMRGTPSQTTGSGGATPAEGQTDGALQLESTTVPVAQPSMRPIQGRVYGGGSGDGVWANLAAKPEAGGEKVEEHPPTYQEAAQDAAPPYWETTILTPGSFDPNEVYIDGLPVGTFFSFIWNATISMSFQIVGFLLTYLLHTTHAAKNGSRAGLGVTLIQYGFYVKNTSEEIIPGGGEGGETGPSDPDNHDWDENDGWGSGGGVGDITGQEWLAYGMMVVGWFLVVRSVGEYVRARRHEKLVLQSPDRGLGVAVIAEGESPSSVV